ncbi:hypothetical protein [Methylocystis rosea]|uniref:DUF4258 domain-containing protein n=1 Tax=Methylocystis rosea TaxID=173366 RepID=A0A3G8M2Y7_9HYPH|nr:hypothetical protein [Methylocystis rosea]AZG76333.1 hypothetical protein EHO51_06095 [Methylocystis rosea]
MQAKVERAYQFETDWIREYAKAFMHCESGIEYSSDAFWRERISLVDIRNVFRNADVTYADKLNGPGATWIVEGDDGDGGYIVAEIVVISETLTVKVVKAIRINRREEK